MRVIRRAWRRLELGWRAGLRRLPFFTQRTAVLLVGVLVAALAMLGGAVALVGWPGANGPTHRGTRVRRCGRRGRRGPAGRTADHPAAPDHHDHRPPGPLGPVNDLLGPVVSTLLP